jgi:hypothetical protein
MACGLIIEHVCELLKAIIGPVITDHRFRRSEAARAQLLIAQMVPQNQ